MVTTDDQSGSRLKEREEHMSLRRQVRSYRSASRESHTRKNSSGYRERSRSPNTPSARVQKADRKTEWRIQEEERQRRRDARGVGESPVSNNSDVRIRLGSVKQRRVTEGSELHEAGLYDDDRILDRAEMERLRQENAKATQQPQMRDTNPEFVPRGNYFEVGIACRILI